jgi:ribonuclease VapC
MVIDTSAVLAWLKNEPERERIVMALEHYEICRISAVSLFEAKIVVCAREHPTMLNKIF